MADAGAAIERAREKTEQMKARAAALDELTVSGTLEDFTTNRSPLDRELDAEGLRAQVEPELASMKAELGSGEATKKKELEQ